MKQNTNIIASLDPASHLCQCFKRYIN